MTKELKEKVRMYLASNENFKDAWDNCQEGDIMIKLSIDLGVSDELVILAESNFAKQSVNFINDDNFLKAIDKAIEYGNGKITKREFDAFRSDFRDALASIEFGLSNSTRDFSEADFANICRECLTEEVFKLINDKMETVKKENCESNQLEEFNVFLKNAYINGELTACEYAEFTLRSLGLYNDKFTIV